jgi:hypothetical protein
VDAILLKLAVAESEIQAPSALLQGNCCNAGRSTATLMDLPELESRPASISQAVIDHELSLLLPLCQLDDLMLLR